MKRFTLALLLAALTLQPISAQPDQSEQSDLHEHYDEATDTAQVPGSENDAGDFEPLEEETYERWGNLSVAFAMTVAACAGAGIVGGVWWYFHEPFVPLAERMPTELYSITIDEHIFDASDTRLEKMLPYFREMGTHFGMATRFIPLWFVSYAKPFLNETTHETLDTANKALCELGYLLTPFQGNGSYSQNNYADLYNIFQRKLARFYSRWIPASWDRLKDATSTNESLPPNINVVYNNHQTCYEILAAILETSSVIPAISEAESDQIENSVSTLVGMIQEKVIGETQDPEWKAQ